MGWWVLAWIHHKTNPTKNNREWGLITDIFFLIAKIANQTKIWNGVKQLFSSFSEGQWNFDFNFYWYFVTVECWSCTESTFSSIESSIVVDNYWLLDDLFFKGFREFIGCELCFFVAAEHEVMNILVVYLLYFACRTGIGLRLPEHWKSQRAGHGSVQFDCRK